MQGGSLCRTCRQLAAIRQIKRYSTAVSTGPSAARLDDKSILEVSGPDAQRFLKGLTCKDVEASNGGYSGFLNASGRVLHTVFIFPIDHQTYLITHDSPSGHPAPLATYLPPFKLRSKVRIRDVSDKWSAWGIWNATSDRKPQRSWKAGSGGAAEASWSWPDGLADLDLRSGEIGCWDLRGGTGKQILTPKGKEPNVSILAQTDYDLHRMQVGIPEGPKEVVPGSALPLESCMDIHGGLDFRKGCYVGQELTVRTYHTGATRKRILPIRLFPLDTSAPILSEPQPIIPGLPSEIMFTPGADSSTRRARSAGKIVALHEKYGSIGLALIRLEMAEKSWWSQPLVNTVKEWVDSGRGRLTTTMNGQEYGVHVDPGEAYGAFMQSET